jgi:hypothetical protein
MAAGCGTRTCKDKTVLVTVTLGATASAADSFDVSVTVGTQTLTSTGVARKSQSASGTLEIDFPDGYPSNQMIEVTVTAKQGGVEVGTGMNGVTLRNACATLGIQIGAPDDLSVPADLAVVPDLRDATVPLDFASPPPDMAMCGHLKEPCCTGNMCLQGNCYGGGAICDNADLMPPSCVPVQALDPVFVDPVLGTDDSMHGRLAGTCAYKTLTFALTQAAGVINLASATYTGGMGGEGTQWVLQNAQEVDCAAGAKLANFIISGDGGVSTVLLLGSSNIRHCELESGSAAIEVPSPNPSAHIIDSCDIHGAFYGIYSQVGQVTVSSSNIHNNGAGGGIHWHFNSAGLTGSMTNNTFSGNAGSDISCAGSDNSVTGSGNTNAGGLTCSGCAHCPF